MTSVRLAAALALLVTLAAPSALAADAEGTFVVEGPIELPEPLRATLPDAALVTRAMPDLEIAASGVHVERHVRTSTVAGGLLGGIVASEDQPVERADHASATLRLEPGTGSFLLAIAAPGGLELDAPRGALSGVTGARLFGDPVVHDVACRPTGAPCLAALGAHELALDDANVVGQGAATLYLDGAVLVVDANGAETRYAAGESAGDVPGATETAVVVVTLDAAQLDLLLRDAAFYSSAPVLETTRARLPDATGAIDVGVRTYRAADDAVETAGALTLVPAAVAPAATFPADGSVAYAERVEAEVLGDVQSINLRATPIYQEAPAESAGLLALLAATVGAVAYFWPHIQFHATAAALPLYSRLQPPKLLDNDVRNAIYDIVRQNPGISARSIHRKSTQSWGTVVYHLRQLESHHLVVSRRFGRARNYYENHGKYRGMEQQLACLRSPRSRALAHAILEQPGLSQEALAEATGLAQPTTSYYARKLAQAQLVTEAREGRYVKYLPTPELERYLRAAESPDLGAPAGAAPAQA